MILNMILKVLKIRYDGGKLPEINGDFIIVRCSSGVAVAYGEGEEILRETKDGKCCSMAAALSFERPDVIFLDYRDAQGKIPGWLGIGTGEFMVPEFGLVYSSREGVNT